MTPEKAYRWLKKHCIESSHLGSLGSIAAWDQRTYLPPSGHPHRAEQMAILARHLHERATHPRIGDALTSIEGTHLVENAVSEEAVNSRQWRKDYDRATRIPGDLAEEIARATSECESVWERSRPESDFDTFKPHLKRVLSRMGEKADAIGYKKEPYDALLEEYEPGETAHSLEGMFERLRVPLVELLDKIQGSSVRPKTEIFRGHFPKEAQAKFSALVARAIGYDMDGGRIDVTAHPFTIGIGPGDVRITTRYHEDYFLSSLMGTIHETGHAMYEQGLPVPHWGTPRGTAASLGVHESQSRLYENLVARSPGMWRYFLPGLQRLFPVFKKTDLDTFVLALNTVEKSNIRVEADEVTYNLHILLRFELELMLMRKTLHVDDLPDAWNDKMKKYLDVVPDNHKDGVMQDVHWAAGLVGYFPTYSLGNIYAAQIFDAAKDALGNIDDLFSKGEFSPLLDWLGKHIHEPGGTYLPRDLVAHATGSEPTPSHLIRYCEDKYTRLYDL